MVANSEICMADRRKNINNFIKVNWKEIFIVILVIGYFSIGIFPIVPIEGDSVNIANGISQFEKQGIGPNEFTYSYDVQAGSYILSYLIHKIFNIEPYKAFAILSALSGLLIIFLSSYLISEKLQTNFIIPFLLIFSFQEAFSGLYYANTNIIAALFAIISFFIFYKYSNIHISSILFAIAIWCRIDVVLIGLIFPLLIYNRHKTKPGFKKFVLFGIITCFTIVILFLISNVNLYNIINRFMAHTKATSGFSGTNNLGIPLLGISDIKSYISFSTFFNIFLTILGIYLFIKKSEKKPLYFTIAGILPLFIIYSGSITTPKYLFYSIPFFTLLSTFSIKTVTNKYLLIFGVVLLFQYVIGLNVIFRNKQYFPGSHPQGLTLYKNIYDDSPIKQVRLNIGAGNYITTADGYRLSSGILFAPFTWKYYKKNRKIHLTKINRQINTYKNIYTHTYLSYSYAKYLLINNKWNFLRKYKNSDSYTVLSFKKNNEIKNIFYKEISDRNKYKKIYKRIDTKNSILIKVYPWEYNISKIN